jgi:hypothetical protein
MSRKETRTDHHREGAHALEMRVGGSSSVSKASTGPPG